MAITPAAGDVQPYGAVILGAVAACCCYCAIQIKTKLGYDDSLDVFGIHGIAGIVGALGLSFLLRTMPDHGFAKQLWYQTEGVVVSIVYSAIMTLALVVLVEKLFGFRMKQDNEMAGMDHSLHGEHGYGLLNLN